MVQYKRLFHSETERIIIVTVLSVLRNIHIRSANLSFTGGEVAEAFVPWHSSAGVLHSMSVVVVMVVMVVGGGAGGGGSQGGSIRPQRCNLTRNLVSDGGSLIFYISFILAELCK